MAKKPAVDGQIALSATKKVTSSKYPATVILSLDNDANEEEIVEIVAEPDNPSDPNALAVYRGGKHIGYIANKPATVREGTRSAAALVKMVSNKATSKVYAVLTDKALGDPVGSEGKRLASFKAYLYFVPKRSSKDNRNIREFETYGGAVSSPNKANLLKRMQEQGQTSVEVVLRQRDASANLAVYLADKDDPLAGDSVSLVKCPTEPELLDAYKAICERLNRHSVVTGTFQLTPDTLGAAPSKQAATLIVDASAGGDPTMVNAAMDRAIARCVDQANALEVRVTTMRNIGLSEEMICQVLDGYQRYAPEFEAMIPAPEYPFVDDPSKALYRAIAYHLHGKHIRLVGEKGCGKNTLIETVAWLMRRPLYRVSGNSDMDKTDLLGSRTIEDGSMTYELTTFLRVLEAGGDVDLDECNSIKPDVELIIHSLTDQTRAINVPGYGEVKMGAQATFWATMNEDYVGVGDMNDATVDRFVTIRLASPTDIKPVLKARVPTATVAELNFCQRVYTDMQKSVQNGELASSCISIRGFIDALEVADCLPLTTALMDTVAAKPQDQSERAAVRTIIENLGTP